MKLVDIVFVLSVAATANAILIPADNNGSPQASSTLSQVSSPTNEPNPGTSDEYQEEPVNLSFPGQIQQQPMYQPNQNQRPTVIVAGPNLFKQGRKRIIDLTTSDQDQQQPTDVAGPSTPKQVRKQPIGKTSQIQQQSMIHNESGNTVPNQITVLSKKYQKTFDRMTKKFECFKKIARDKHKEYYNHANLKLSQQLALAMGKEIPESMCDPNTEKRLKQEYEKLRRKVVSARQRLKDFMRKHGLEFDEPSSNLD
ncbi:hypothetical protein BDEG_28311 [Batrachochytrium dendrobatidis JEL423]|uniref:Uncharacterized protein n=1 Tax=Batrachochytrium dendrobatidis (strain JEL423) TaxID=403673 RepID=A0A177X0F5_BATDL|nr:hypothetical protein BDEG_28311 [Batrachochytrium dendrobatidis JEL423]